MEPPPLTPPWNPRRTGRGRSRFLIAGASAGLSLAVLFLGAWSRHRLEGEIVQLRGQLDSDHRSRERLEREVERQRHLNHEIQARLEAETERRFTRLQHEEGLREQFVRARAIEGSLLEERLASNSLQIDALRRERSLNERTIKEMQGGVAFLEGAYRYQDASGKPLRYAGVDANGDPAKDVDGKPLYTIAGSGTMVEIGYTGTGFLVSSSGSVLTNRHVAEPWWGEAEEKTLTEKGFFPILLHLRAYFPSVKAAFPLEVVRISPRADLALLKADLGGHRVPVLRIEPAVEGVSSGQPVVLLGYPTGLDALLARLDRSVVGSVTAAVGSEDEDVARELARRGMIRPLATHGHLGDVLPNRLVYDAPTAVGGSGGPIFDAQGRVIGVNAAILPDFAGASFGVPISFGRELMRASGPAR